MVGGHFQRPFHPAQSILKASFCALSFRSSKAVTLEVFEDFQTVFTVLFLQPFSLSCFLKQERLLTRPVSSSSAKPGLRRPAQEASGVREGCRCHQVDEHCQQAESSSSKDSAPPPSSEPPSATASLALCPLCCSPSLNSLWASGFCCSLLSV